MPDILTTRFGTTCIRSRRPSMMMLMGVMCLGPVAESSPGVSSAGAQAGWTYEEPGGTTGCALDTPYAFFHRDLSGAENLLVYFQGGGACWEWVSCSGMFDTDVSRDELADYGGIFDVTNPANPFRDFGVVFVPYCTGDVHVGTETRRYGDGPTAGVVHHNGYRNVTAVLKWLEHRVSPSRIVVAGASAGSYGALFHVGSVARRFPAATTMMIGDSGVPLLLNHVEILDHWGARAALREAWAVPIGQPVDLDLIRAHGFASMGGTVRLAQITSDRDAIQSAFYLISGSPDVRAATYAILDGAAASVDGFRSFVVGGADHGLLRTDRFYEYAADGVALRDWVADFVAGRPVHTVRCAACRLP